MIPLLFGIFLGMLAYAIVRVVPFGLFTVAPNERVVKTSFGRAQRLPGNPTILDDPISETLDEQARERYIWPQVKVIGPGGPYIQWPWEEVHRVNVATVTADIAYDPDAPRANHNNTILDAVTKDNLEIGLTGQLRYSVNERNLYAYIFGVKNPVAHILGYFVSILRERIANFEAPKVLLDGEQLEDPAAAAAAAGISLNELRKNLREVNEHIERECSSAPARYGVNIEAALVTSLDPPQDVESALAAINTAHNSVSSDISLAHAEADQKITMSKRAVEIETLKAQAEVEPLIAVAEQLRALKAAGSQSLPAYLRSVTLSLFGKAKNVLLEVQK